jgi:hypothetical protein
VKEVKGRFDCHECRRTTDWKDRTPAQRRAQLPALEAYHAYLRGRFHWNKHTLIGYRRAVEWLNRGVEIQPGCVAPVDTRHKQP